MFHLRMFTLLLFTLNYFHSSRNMNGNTNFNLSYAFVTKYALIVDIFFLYAILMFDSFYFFPRKFKNLFEKEKNSKSLNYDEIWTNRFLFCLCTFTFHSFSLRNMKFFQKHSNLYSICNILFVLISILYVSLLFYLIK